MSLTSRRNGTGRIYVRRFDHEEAARLRFEEGARVVDLAARYGVTTKAIYDATTPGTKALRIAGARRWRTGTCEDCGGPAMRLVNGKLEHNPDGRTLCITCRGRAKRTRFHFDVDGVLTEARCLTCQEWKSPATFPAGDRFKDVRPNGIHDQCRSCQTKARQDYRERHKEPCVGCGKPALPASEKRTNGASFARCRACQLKELRAAQRGEAISAHKESRTSAA